MSRRVRPTIAAAVAWIAYNDEPSDRDHRDVADTISVLLVADLFGHTPEYIAKLVVAVRGREDI